MPHRFAPLALLVLAFTAQGCGDPSPARSIYVDARIEQSGGVPGIREASLLLDGKEIARFAQAQPESSVVFSKMVDDVTPGRHVLAVRVDGEEVSPTAYMAAGVAHFQGKEIPLKQTGGVLATGQSLRFDFQL